MTIPVIDVFAGPGGLNEGFSSLRAGSGNPIFQTRASFEMDPVACQTLRLRAALRLLRNADGDFPLDYYKFLRAQMTSQSLHEASSMRTAFDKSEDEVLQLELGPSTRHTSDRVISERIGSRDDWVLVGGPPCQAYSLVGRSRRSHDLTFEDDHKHFLYREYLHVLHKHQPAVFVMENVKGMLSATHGGSKMFPRIVDDLQRAGYDIRSLVTDSSDLKPADFVIKSELFGVPQRRHRVILLGIRQDLGAKRSGILGRSAEVSVADAIGSLPPVRSLTSPKRDDAAESWALIRGEALSLAMEATGGQMTSQPIPQSGAAFVPWQPPPATGEYLDWITNEKIGGVPQHDPRSHMPADLQRYAYMAAVAGPFQSPKLQDLPDALLPLHKNVGLPNTPFTDRFRVQVSARPSTTVVSHISKDGNYFIHPDPSQMRSLTVREAARLQSFPDDYFFCGPRTQQFHQVGNAVPPFLARQIAAVVADFLD